MLHRVFNGHSHVIDVGNEQIFAHFRYDIFLLLDARSTASEERIRYFQVSLTSHLKDLFLYLRMTGARCSSELDSTRTR